MGAARMKLLAFFRCFVAVLCVAFSSLNFAGVAPNTLEAFNSSPTWDGTSAEISDDPALVAQFKGKNFVCRDVNDYTPKESEAAAHAFSEFVLYSIAGDKVDNFWMDETHRKERERLLSTALKAESWKADYLDSVWTIRYSKDAKTRQAADARLIKLVEKGVPIAVYKYARYLFGRDGKYMYYLLDAAIDRGSPNAMVSVGTTIIVQSKALRPIGKAFLECAASRGHASAYKGLGILADMEGRRLDAYRLWGKGVNEGCEACISYMLNIAKSRDYSPNRSLEEFVPELVRIKKFHDESVFYRMTELSDFKRQLPAELFFHPGDAELLLLLKNEQALRNQ